jgi:hypothetical protein
MLAGEFQIPRPALQPLVQKVLDRPKLLIEQTDTAVDRAALGLERLDLLLRLDDLLVEQSDLAVMIVQAGGELLDLADHELGDRGVIRAPQYRLGENDLVVALEFGLQTSQSNHFGDPLGLERIHVRPNLSVVQFNQQITSPYQLTLDDAQRADNAPLGMLDCLSMAFHRNHARSARRARDPGGGGPDPRGDEPADNYEADKQRGADD